MPGLADAVARDACLEGVPSALAAARDGVDALLRDRGLRRTTPSLTTESLMRGAVASARLEGSAATVDDLRSGRCHPVGTDAARLYAELLSLVPVVGRSPLQALARMHALAAPPGQDADSVGRPRESPILAPRMQALAHLLVGTGAGAPAVAVAAVAHAEVAVMGPFKSANGLIARALERLVLVARGVDPTSLTVPEAGHLAAGANYRRALAAYAAGDLEGRRQWLLHAATAITAGAAASPLVS